MHLNDPYVVTYEGIYAICDRKNRFVEIIENSRCYGGSAWTMHHYASSPLIIDVRSVGNMIRYRTRAGTSELTVMKWRSPMPVLAAGAWVPLCAGLTAGACSGPISQNRAEAGQPKAQ